MYKYSLVIIFLLLVSFSGFAQQKTDTAVGAAEAEVADTVSTTLPIEIRKGLFTSFYQRGEKLSTSLLQDVVVKSPEAVAEMQRARKNYLGAVVLNTAGSFLIGYPVASSLLSGNKLNLSLTGLGIAMVGAGIPLSRAYVKHAQNAATIHNQRLGKTTGFKPTWQFGFAGTGAGLQVTF
ncbi:MAG: hypothetical protein COW65_14800 [Cytophagales bacterium CG18_big_fil_WC_8_21_14_2_50_42_9]|nr:MAG: hypothetical protein COW65_14800 [Cytophagales bacterium CG18_big_fil_WC_8_21_14_2_50_42_9]